MKKTLLLCAIMLSFSALQLCATTMFEVAIGTGALAAVGLHTGLCYKLAQDDPKQYGSKERKALFAALQSVVSFGSSFGISLLIDKYYSTRALNYKEAYVRGCALSIAGVLIAQSAQQIDYQLGKDKK